MKRIIGTEILINNRLKINNFIIKMITFIIKIIINKTTNLKFKMNNLTLKINNNSKIIFYKKITNKIWIVIIIKIKDKINYKITNQNRLIILMIIINNKLIIKQIIIQIKKIN